MSSTAPAARTRAGIVAVAREHLAAELRIEHALVTDDCVLRELPGADSIHLLRVVSRLEREWDIEFDDDDVFSSNTFAELVEMICSYLARRQ